MDADGGRGEKVLLRSDAMSVQRCEWHLDNWAEWMAERFNKLGYPSRASGRMGKSHTTDFDSMVRSADVRCALAIDALIDDLPETQRAAVYSIKLAEPWQTGLPLERLYDIAVRTLAGQLSHRGIM
jgi:hypothetical protein